MPSASRDRPVTPRMRGREAARLFFDEPRPESPLRLSPTHDRLADWHAPNPGLLPVDRWVAGITAAFAILWLPLIATAPLARWFFATHVAALLLPVLLDRHRGPFPPALAALRECYPLLWIAAFWTELGLRYPLVANAANDAFVAAADRRIFGVHWNDVWAAAMPAPWLSELMHGAYCSYYALLIGVPALLALRGCRTTLRELTLRMAVTYLACFVVYAAFPVRGPFDLPHTELATVTAGWFHGLMQAARAAGDAAGTAFPSSHTAGAVTFAIILWRRGPRMLAWPATVAATLIALATVYTRNHFPVDTVAGIAVAWLAQYGLVPWLLGPRRPGSAWRAGAPNPQAA